MHNFTLHAFLSRKSSITELVNTISFKIIGLFILLFGMFTLGTHGVFAKAPVLNSFSTSYNYTYSKTKNLYGLENSSELTPIQQLSQPGEIQGPQNVCPGTTVTYSVPQVTNATEYIWTLPTGLTIIDGANTNSITVSIESSAPFGQVHIKVVAKNNTVTSQDRQKVIDIKRLSVAPTTIRFDNTNFSGSNICINHTGQNENINLTVSGGVLGEGARPKWYEGSCNGTLKKEGNDLPVNLLEGQSKTFYVNYQGTCNTTDCITVTVTRGGSLDGTSIGAITGQQEVCKNSNNITYTVPEVSNAANYTWTLPPGASSTTGNLVTTTNSITVNYVNASAGNVTVVANGVGDCGGNSLKSSLVINIEDVPNAPSFINPVSNICYGDSQTYTVSEIPGATSYNWTVPNGASIVSGNGTRSITVNFNTASSGNITVTAVNACGTGNTSTLPITINNVPNNPGPITGPTAVCPEQTMVEYTIPSLPNTTSYDWRISNGSATFNGTSNTNSIALDISNIPSNNFTISVVGVNACGESALASELIIHSNIVPIAPSNITATQEIICAGFSTTLTANGGTLGTNGAVEWFTNSCGGTPVSGGTGNTITVSPTNTTTYFARYKGDCGETSCAQITINVVQPVDSAGSIVGNEIVCKGDTNVTYTVPTIENATSYIWTVSTGASITSTPPYSNSITVDYSNSTSSVDISVKGTNEVCGEGNPSSLTVTMNTPSVAPSNITATQETICAGFSTTLTANGGTLGTNGAVEWFTNSCGGTLISGGTGNTITVSPTNTTTYFARYKGDCGETSCAQITITVNPIPTVIATPTSQIVCSEETITDIVLTNPNNVNGTTFSWESNIDDVSGLSFISTSTSNTISGSFLNTTGAPQTAIFTIKASANSCESIETTATVTVNPEPVISVNLPSQTICSEGSISAINIINENSVSGISYTWTRDNSTNITGMNASGSGSPISGALTNTSGVIQTTTFTITASANGCTSETTATVSVNPEPVISVNLPSQTICSEDSFTPINIINENNVSGISFTWTRDNTTNLIGMNTSGNGSPITGALTNTSGVIQTTTFTITASANGCTSKTTATVTVNPEPVVSVNLPSQTICSEDSISAINILNDNNVSGISFTWTRDNTTNLTGIDAGGTGSPISGTLTNTSGVVQTTTFTITASANGCTSETTATITVNPKPELSATFTPEICSGETTDISIVDENNVDKSLTYVWSRNNTSGITGPSNGDSNNIAINLTNTTNTIQTTTFTVTANSEYNCISEPLTVTISVNPSPTISATNTLQTICNGESINDIILSNPNDVSGVSYSWTRNNTTGITGLESGTGSSISGSLTNVTNSPQTTTFTITATANGCASEITTATITVNPDLVIAIDPDLRPGVNETICSDSSITPIQILNVNNVDDVKYFWERTDDFSSSVSGMENGTGPNISGTLTSTHNRNRIVKFKAWAELNGCISNVIEGIEIRVTPIPIVQVNPTTQAICDGDSFSMNFDTTNSTNNTNYSWEITNLPAGVTTSSPSGTGITASGTFTNATTETQTVTFTITATRAGCSTTTTATVDVYAQFTKPEIGDDQAVCLYSYPTPLQFINPNLGGSGNYSYQWQRSENANNEFTDINGANSITYQPPRVPLWPWDAVNYYYRVVVSDECGTETSNIIFIQVITDAGFNIESTGKPEGFQCPGDDFTISISSIHGRWTAVRYSWSSNSEFFSPASGGPVGTTDDPDGWWDIFRESEGSTDQIILQNNTNETVTSQFEITPHVYDYSNNPTEDDLICSISPEIIDVTIYPTPKILSVTAEEENICSGTSTTILVDGNITDADMSFSWTRNETTDVTGANSGESTSADIDDNNVFTLSNELINTSTSPITVTYTITPKSTTCDLTGEPKTIEITVLPFIEAVASYSGTLENCDDTTVNLQANNNIAGVWTALPLGGVFSSTTDPNAIFTGESGTNYTLTWTISNGELCGDSSAEVVVNIPACSGNDFEFNGINTSVNFGNAYNLVGPFSIEIWAKPNSDSGNQTIFSKRSSTNTTSGYDLTLSGTSIQFNYNDGGTISASGLSDTRWYHIAVTYNGSIYKLYIDGVEKATAAGNGVQTNSGLALLGAKQTATLPNNFYNGWLDELRIWNKALSVDQIREMMNQEIQDNSGKVRGVVIPENISGDLNWNSNLVDYYQMGSSVQNGILTSAKGSTTGVLRNMTDIQQETAPLPYNTFASGNWDTESTWANGAVNQLPNSTDIDWNIVKINHNVNISSERETTVLGLIVEDNTLTVLDETPLYVSKYLKLDGTLKLDGEAQLLQPEGSLVDYTGAGGLLRDQKGTKNVYNYNYWASPVSTAGNVNSRTYSLQDILHVGSTPVGWTADFNGAAGNPPSISTRWLYTFYDAIANMNSWNKITQNEEIPVGSGFIMKGTSADSYTFIGQPNNGDYLASVTAGNDALVGNPYPSAIDANTFITDNETILNDGGNNGEIRYWKQASTNNSHVTKEYLGGYASYNLTGGTPGVAPEGIAGSGDASEFVPGRYVPVAQGFFITAGQSGNVIFNNGQRIFKTQTDGVTFSRSVSTSSNEDNEVQRLRLSFKNPDNAIRQLLLGFTPDNAATDGIDFGYDATNFQNLPNDMLFLINNKTYIIQGVGAFDESKQYPLAVLMGKDGNIEISLKELENFDTPIDVYIYDSYSDTYTQINNSKYKTHLDKGDYMDRYFLAFKDENKLDIVENEFNSIKINYLNQTNEIHIKTPDYTEIKQVYLVNILGQTVQTWNATNAPLSQNCKIPVRRVSEGNYIIKVETTNGVKSNKISIKY
ncbi:PKD-like domain-containing protein [Formosa haliotis]|uniref:PKD-like domain-containing protein n=1 Tax=Formosa haliotis TaxID=1555194 RepID=UPI00082621A1|nr:PKD-like domain-containing protein [Formosa haliotis]